VKSWLSPYVLLASWRFKKGKRLQGPIATAIAMLLLSVPAWISEGCGFGDLLSVEATPAGNTVDN
jgi:hypothetical protein